MTKISRSALIQHPAHRMYDLVNDVERYPEFLPWCRAARAIEQTHSAQTASISMVMTGIKQQFTTQNTMIPGERIDMALVDGPFSQLKGCWQFKALGDEGCKITLDMEFLFSSVLLEKTVGILFSDICNSLVDAFCQRADALQDN